MWELGFVCLLFLILLWLYAYPLSQAAEEEQRKSELRSSRSER